MAGKTCEHGRQTKPNGNCTVPGDDGLPVQCVGRWASRKHDYLSRYVEATYAARAKYLPPQGRGGAAYIDLFAGPGRARIRKTGEIVDGTPLIAASHARAPFTEILLCDLDEENISCLSQRLSGDARVERFHGDANTKIREIVPHIPAHGLNFALIDPFAPSVLHWATLKRLARFKRMDLLIHFPTGAIKRNFKHSGFDRTLDRMLGTREWRKDVRTEHDVAGLVRHLRRQLVGEGYEDAAVRDVAVKNNKNTILYHLVYASKNPRGTAIWQSITKIEPSGQRGFDF